MIIENINLWDDGFSCADGFKPHMTGYILETADEYMKDKKYPALVICPGGGYHFRSRREAEPVATEFMSEMYHVFVVEYSVEPSRFPQALMDISRAMCIIRDNADMWNVDPDKIAVMGFSAGGHLACSLAALYNRDYLSDACGGVKGKNRPNLLIGCYPVITNGEKAHRGSFNNLIGDDESLLAETSLEKQVHKDMPPTFLWHTFEDATVPLENTLMFANALREKNIPIEVHIFPEGRHGLSLCTPELNDNYTPNLAHNASWVKLCKEWMSIYFK